MKENKYKGKTSWIEDKIHKKREWVKGYYVRTQHCFPEKDDEMCFMHWIIDENGIKHKVIPESIGQYICSNDRYGEEIYEGDIVKTPYGEGAVRFGKTKFMVNGEYEEKYIGFFIEGFDEMDEAVAPLYDKDCEVIGNIYDGKEGESDV